MRKDKLTEIVAEARTLLEPIGFEIRTNWYISESESSALHERNTSAFVHHNDLGGIVASIYSPYNVWTPCWSCDSDSHRWYSPHYSKWKKTHGKMHVVDCIITRIKCGMRLNDVDQYGPIYTKRLDLKPSRVASVLIKLNEIKKGMKA